VGNPSSCFSYRHLTPDGVNISWATTAFQKLWRPYSNIRATTRIRPYGQIQSLRCISQQLCIMNYKGPPSALGKQKKTRLLASSFFKILILLIQTQIRCVFRRSTTEFYSFLNDKSFKLLICLPLCLSWHQHFQLS